MRTRWLFFDSTVAWSFLRYGRDRVRKIDLSAAQDIQAQVGAWQSNRINVLTIVTMIFLPITFLTGYFGMNFSWLDNQLNSYANWMALGVALPILLVLGCSALLAARGYTVPRIFKRRRRSKTST